MGEALTPGAKVGTQFKKGKGKLVDVAADVREMVVTNSRDVVVIVDEKLRGTGDGSKQMAERTAEVIKAAGCVIIIIFSQLISYRFLQRACNSCRDLFDGEVEHAVLRV